MPKADPLMTANEQPDSTQSVKRRQALKYLGSGALSASLGLAGCVQQSDGGGGGEASDIGTVKFGVLVPTSGPSAPLGKAQRQGAQLGIEFVNDSDQFDFEIDPVYEDTQTDPSTGREKAEKVVKQDGAKYIAGALESSVALAVADFVSQEEVGYMSGAATVDITGKDCNKNTFRYESNAAQHTAGVTDFAANELGTKWWLHSTDEAYGKSAFNQIERRIDSRDLDVDIVGRSMPDFGTSNYGPQISKISNSDADVLIIPETGGDLINFMKQADKAGLKEEVDIIGTALFAQVSRRALGPTAVGTYSSTLYNHQLETGDNRQFVQAYQNEYDVLPGNFARVGYELIRTAARGIQAASTSELSQVRDTLEGLEFTTVLGQTSYRPCDHQCINPVWTGKIVEADEGTKVELLNKIPGEETVRPCEETGCNL